MDPITEHHVRTAFTAALVLDRRQQAQDTSATSAVAIDSTGQRLYVGLEDGVLEEHALVRGTEGVRAALAARRHAARKVRPCDAFALDLRSPAPFWACKRAYTRLICLQAISGIHALPEHGLVVLLSEDGLVHVLDAETLEGQPLPLRWVASRGRRTWGKQQ